MRLVGAGFDYPSVMDMAWTDARDFLAARARIAREEMISAAVAARAAQATEDGWKQWMRELAQDVW